MRLTNEQQWFSIELLHVAHDLLGLEPEQLTMGAKFLLKWDENSYKLIINTSRETNLGIGDNIDESIECEDLLLLWTGKESKEIEHSILHFESAKFPGKLALQIRADLGDILNLKKMAAKHCIISCSNFKDLFEHEKLLQKGKTSIVNLLRKLVKEEQKDCNLM